MRRVGIIPNSEKDQALTLTKNIVSFIKEQGCEPMIAMEVVKNSDLSQFGCEEKQMFETAEFIIVLGGDGTLLSAGRKTAPFGVPILGINLGHLGFLTAVDKSETETAILQVLKKEYKLEKRLMVEASITSVNKKIKGILALNEICVSRGIFSKLVDIDVYINSEFMDTFRADGILISTPTGSTAYNLSAGGPILKPDSEIIAITPICPHTLYTRSTAISASDTVTLEMHTGNPKRTFILSADGQEGIPFQCDHVVRIERSRFYTNIIKTKPEGFYDILREKLLRNGG